MFRDECEIEVTAGRGGDGLVSFAREKYAPKGGPNGGDGGHGGHVILLATDEVNSLIQVGRKPYYRARNGEPGGPRNRSGGRGDDLIIQVPLGTQVFDAARDNLMADLAEGGQELILAKAGTGGRGNASFATSVHQAPRKAERGRDGESRRVRLELKLVAEVGLVGLPNAGKSTFLSRVSRARPKVADYPFTTLDPHVGIATVGDHDTLVIADLPGLIEGAAEGHGLGHRFLKHVERCRVLLQLVDLADGDAERAEEDLRVISGELARYSDSLSRRPRLIVATKVEGDSARAAAELLRERIDGPLHVISAHTGEGLLELLREAKRTVTASVEADDATEG